VTSRRKSVKLVPFSYDETCSEVKNKWTRRTNHEVDRLRDVREVNGLFLVVDEEAQRARGRVEVDLHHHRRVSSEFLVSFHPTASVDDNSSRAATNSEEMREGEGEETSSRQSRGLVGERT
jgi:hypothetical protein